MNTTPLLELLSLTAMKGAAVLLMALLLGMGLRRMAAARRYALWITALTALAVLPLAMVLLPAWRVLPKTSAELEWPKPEVEQLSQSVALAESLPDGQPFMPASSVQTQAPDPTEIRRAISWQDVVAMLPLAWALVALCLLLRLGWSAWRLRCLESALRPGECEKLIETARLLGLRRLPRLFIGPQDAVPMVWGVLRPRLLLPQGFEDWHPEKQRGVLLHELAHLKRGDPLALWIAQWVKALHWFNPLAWLTLRHLRADQERACDDAVLRHGVRASDYAQSLLDLSRHQRLAPGLSLCALTITRCAPVESRVKDILDPRRRREGLNLRWLVALAGCALLITLPVAMLHAIESARMRGRILDRNGVVLAESTQEKGRVYPLKTLAAQTIGYSVTLRTESNEQKHKGFTGVEKKQDAKLATGEDATLALDMRIQSLVHQAMKDGGIERGAAVVLDPRTGEILAAVSLPCFDPNRFVQAMKPERLDTIFENLDWPTRDRFVQAMTPEKLDAMFKNVDRPTLNRCFRAVSPGSTFKILTGLAGEAAGLGDPKYDCTGSITYGSKPMQCWIHAQNGGGHGVLGLSDSLAVSCNCYWYQFGNAAGIDQIESMGRRIGFGSAYGITEDESPGILPCPNWQRQYHPKESWSAGHTANTAIGQGYTLATPLQMAVLAATVGNGGRVPQPSLVKQNGPIAWREDLTRDTLTTAEIEPVREGMRRAVNSDIGTGRPARSDKVVIAGKTGTAQNWRKDENKTTVEDNLGWFIGFAPYENPQLAFAIVKNGAKSGGSDCGPIGRRIVEEALALPADGSGTVQPMEEVLSRLQQEQARFDARAETLRAVVEGIRLENATGFHLDEITVHRGKLTLRGTASGMIQALQFRQKLTFATFEVPLKWMFPVPRTLQDGQRVEFRAEGSMVWEEKKTGAIPVENSDGSPQAHAAELDAAEFLRQIRSIDAAPGVTIRGFQRSQGKVTVLGDAEGEIPARKYLFKLLQLGKEQHLRWTSPIIKTLENQRVQFEATSMDEAAPLQVAPPSTTQAQLRQQRDDDIRMKPEQAKQWAVLKQAGLLADLPAEAVIREKNTQRLQQYVPGEHSIFRFSLPQETARRWLLASVHVEGPRAKLDGVFPAANHCTIVVISLNNGTANVTVFRSKPLPDNQKPRGPDKSRWSPILI